MARHQNVRRLGLYYFLSFLLLLVLVLYFTTSLNRSRNYTKDPYPWALNEAFDVYRVLAESNGRAIGMSGRRPIKIILSGDSAYVVELLNINNRTHTKWHVLNIILPEVRTLL